jgi:hypothetical protein
MAACAPHDQVAIDSAVREAVIRRRPLNRERSKETEPEMKAGLV